MKDFSISVNVIDKGDSIQIQSALRDSDKYKIRLSGRIFNMKPDPMTWQMDSYSGEIKRLVACQVQSIISEMVASGDIPNTLFHNHKTL